MLQSSILEPVDRLLDRAVEQEWRADGVHVQRAFPAGNAWVSTAGLGAKAAVGLDKPRNTGQTGRAEDISLFPAAETFQGEKQVKDGSG